MLVDLLSSDNYISINISMIRLFGLQGAVYCSELLSIYNKAKRKEKIKDGFIKVDRDYIRERTSLTVEEQLKLDLAWINLNLLEKDINNPDVIKLDLELLLGLFTTTTAEQFAEITKKAQATRIKGSKDAKHESVKRALKASIQCQDYNLLCALYDWIDSVFEFGKGMSKQALALSINKLTSYANGDTNVAMSIVQIATAQGYVNIDWAINQYEKDKKYKQQQVTKQQTVIRTTKQEKATSDTISHDLFF